MNRLFILLILLCFSWQTATAQTEPLPEAEYWLLVESAVDAIEQNADLTEITQQITAVDTIQLENGEIVQINTEYLVDLLQADELGAQHVEQLETLLATREQLPLVLDESAMLTALEAITSRSEFQYESVLPDSLLRVIELLSRAFEFLFQLLEAGVENGTASVFAWIVTGLAVAGLGAFLWYWLRGVRHQFSGESELGEVGDQDEGISADAAFNQAQTLADSRDYRQAVRYLYLSTLLSLDERGLLRYDRSKTNREYLRSVHGSEFSAPLSRVIDVFDRVWYGFQPIDAETYARYAQTVRRLRGT